MRGVYVKFSACIDMMYPEYDFADRISAAKADGVDAVEFWKWTDKDIDAIKKSTEKLGLDVALFNIDSTDEKLSYDLSRGILSHGRTDDFIRALNETVPVMKKLGCDKIIVLAGDVDEKIPYSLALDNIYKVLKAAAPVAESYGVMLLLEPLNTYDRPSYVLPYSRDAFDIVKGVSSPSVKLLLDIYHTQRMEGNLIDTIEKNIAHIGHFHVANSPYRCEPDNGEIDYRAVLTAIDATTYNDCVGFEYRVRNSGFSLKKYIEEYKAR